MRPLPLAIWGTTCLFFLGPLQAQSTSLVQEKKAILEQPVQEHSAHQRTLQQRAVQQAIRWLESDMVNWRETRHCAACHHGPMYLWSISVAMRQGYRVDVPRYDELSRWLIESDEARVFPKRTPTTNTNSADRMSAQMMGKNNLSQPTIAMLPALRAMQEDNPLRARGWSRVVEHLASAQHQDGSFVGRDAWRPIFNSPSVLTLQVATGLAGADQKLMAAPTAPISQLAQKFLAAHPADDLQQTIVFQILHSISSNLPGSPPQEVHAWVRSLLASQRSDGGWAQTEERESDAFATGQALYALHQFGLEQRHPSVQSALSYLVKSQQPDGTWRMTSRPNPEDGKPATNLNPITYAATAWATIAMAQYIRGD